MKRYSKATPKKTKRGTPACNTMSEMKRSVFEDMSVSDVELRVPNDKPPLRFAPEKSNLNESNKVEFSLRDNVKAFLECRADIRKKTPLGNGVHKAKAY